MKFAIFDFDGTLTQKDSHVWRKLWEKCGYEIGKDSLYANLYVSFMRGKITHQEWCDLTCKAFMSSGLNREDVLSVAQSINLIGDMSLALNTLKDNGFSLHIVSGGVKEVIESALGKDVGLFDSINANNFQYDKSGKLIHIDETIFDYSGKADFIKKLKLDYGASESDICFIGNGLNDEWVYKEGCKTICINPDDDVRHSDKNIWSTCVQSSGSLVDIVPAVLDITNEM